ncbi:hypothetical protein C8J57DRAFT_605348 [Mycena rebaudengoi]|nr:hypothetical protein C8J57DRAFT_605348 [Mycena rebaudengoi]
MMCPLSAVSIFLCLSLATLAPIRANAAPVSLRATEIFNSTAPPQYQQNAILAQFMNKQFANMADTDSCSGNVTACIAGAYAACVSDVWVLTPCAGDLVCASMPLTSSSGTVLSCDTLDDISQRFALAGIDSGLGGEEDCEDEDADADDSEAAPGSSSAAFSASSESTLLASGLPARRFYRRQVADSIAAASTTVAATPSSKPDVTVHGVSEVPRPGLTSLTLGTASTDPPSSTDAPLSSAPLPVTASSPVTAAFPSNTPLVVIGADGRPIDLVIVTVSAGPLSPADNAAAGASSPPAITSLGTALPPDPTSIVFGALPTLTSTLTVTASAVSQTAPASNLPVSQGAAPTSSGLAPASVSIASGIPSVTGLPNSAASGLSLPGVSSASGTGSIASAPVLPSTVSLSSVAPNAGNTSLSVSSEPAPTSPVVPPSAVPTPPVASASIPPVSSAPLPVASAPTVPSVLSSAAPVQPTTSSPFIFQS